jgi:hypothetical protein
VAKKKETPKGGMGIEVVVTPMKGGGKKKGKGGKC